MARFNEAWLAHQRKRFTRPDGQRYLRPDAERWLTPAERQLLSPDGPDRSGIPSRERKQRSDQSKVSTKAVEAERAELLRLKRVLADLKFDLALLRFARKYRPDQPRDDRGRWVDEGGVSNRVRLAAGDKPRLGPGAIAAIALQVAKLAIEAYRNDKGLWDLFRKKDGAVTYAVVDGQELFGSNSNSPTYRTIDRTEVDHLRTRLLTHYPDEFSTDDIGRMPNNALYHAETNILLRAARPRGRTLENQTLEIFGDTPLCNNCRRVLPFVGLELGNPTVTFIGPDGARHTMKDGTWISRER